MARVYKVSLIKRQVTDNSKREWRGEQNEDKVKPKRLRDRRKVNIACLDNSSYLDDILKRETQMFVTKRGVKVSVKPDALNERQIIG